MSEEQEVVDLCMLMYKEAFVRGWKHCEEAGDETVF